MTEEEKYILSVAIDEVLPDNDGSVTIFSFTIATHDPIDYLAWIQHHARDYLKERKK